MNEQLLRQALEDICKGAPTEPPEVYEGDNHGDTAYVASQQSHFFYAEIARAALNAPEPIILTCFVST